MQMRLNRGGEKRSASRPDEVLRKNRMYGGTLYKDCERLSARLRTHPKGETSQCSELPS